jgi:hypothetical protein
LSSKCQFILDKFWRITLMTSQIEYFCRMIHRFIRDDVRYITGYHAQEFRHSGELTKPIQGKPDEAWLGVGYYFWLEEDFAHFWGRDKKKDKTGFYDVYRAHITDNSILNASFSEKDYFQFRKMLDDTIQLFKSQGKKITLLQVNRFLADKVWPNLGIKGIIFDDLPQNKDAKNRVYSDIDPFYYKRRIQLVVFDLFYIHNFTIFKEELC